MSTSGHSDSDNSSVESRGKITVDEALTKLWKKLNESANLEQATAAASAGSAVSDEDSALLSRAWTGQQHRRSSNFGSWSASVQSTLQNAVSFVVTKALKATLDHPDERDATIESVRMRAGLEHIGVEDMLPPSEYTTGDSHDVKTILSAPKEGAEGLTSHRHVFYLTQAGLSWAVAEQYVKSNFHGTCRAKPVHILWGIKASMDDVVEMAIRRERNTKLDDVKERFVVECEHPRTATINRPCWKPGRGIEVGGRLVLPYASADMVRAEDVSDLYWPHQD